MHSVIDTSCLWAQFARVTDWFVRGVSGKVLVPLARALSELKDFCLLLSGLLFCSYLNALRLRVSLLVCLISLLGFLRRTAVGSLSSDVMLKPIGRQMQPVRCSMVSG